MDQNLLHYSSVWKILLGKRGVKHISKYLLVERMSFTQKMTTEASQWELMLILFLTRVAIVEGQIEKPNEYIIRNHAYISIH